MTDVFASKSEEISSLSNARAPTVGVSHVSHLHSSVYCTLFFFSALNTLMYSPITRPVLMKDQFFFLSRSFTLMYFMLIIALCSSTYQLNVILQSFSIFEDEEYKEGVDYCLNDTFTLFSNGPQKLMYASLMTKNILKLFSN